MKVIYDLDQIPDFDPPIALTLGVYDGMHLGHQAIMKRLHKHTRKTGTRVVLTFANHPTHILTPNRKAPLITTLSHRLHLFQAFGVHAAIVLPFTQAVADIPYNTFIDTLFSHLPFNYLILGEETTFGKNREGNAINVRALGERLGFEALYLKKESYHKEIVSSGRIRKSIEKGDLKHIKKLLGRPYSIQAPFDPADVVYENDNLYKWSISVKHLCLLPSAVYSINIEGKEKIPAVGVLEGSTTLTGETELTLTLFCRRIPNASSHLNLTFVEYMHHTFSPNLLGPASLLQKLIPQPSLCRMGS